MRSGRKALLARNACRDSANRLKLNLTSAEKSKSDFLCSLSRSWLNVKDCSPILRPDKILARRIKIAGKVSKSDYLRLFNRKSLLLSFSSESKRPCLQLSSRGSLGSSFKLSKRASALRRSARGLKASSLPKKES